MDARKLLEENLALVDRVIRSVARRQRLDESEAEEFGSVVKLKLCENDYNVIRKFKRRSNLSTYLTIVVGRLLLDDRNHHWGKWHASADAKRLGEVGVELERLLHRDGRSLDEALPMLRSKHPEVTRESLAAIAEQLPKRRPRRRMVDLDEAESVAAEPETEERVLLSERAEAARRLSCAMRDALARLSEADRFFLQLKYDSRLTVAQIARSMHIEQKLLSRRMDKLLSDLGAELRRAGIDQKQVTELIGREGAELDFVLGTPQLRPSKNGEGSVAAPEEEVTR